MTRIGAITEPDPYATLQSATAGLVYYPTTGKTLRSAALNPSERTLVLITAGQSNFQNIAPTTYVPTNAAKIDNINLYDGLIYAAAEPLLGTGRNTLPFGDGNVATRIADTLIINGKFDRVVLAPIAIGATSISQWDPAGELGDRISQVIRRLTDCGISAFAPNVTVAMIWGQGENDPVKTQVSYQAALQRIINKTLSLSPNMRIFINKETWYNGVVSAQVQAAQWAVIDNVKVFKGFDADGLDNSHRQPGDGVHFIDKGMIAMAAGIVAAMTASGTPF